MIKSVAIIGAGFSGTLQAINLLRHDGPRAILIERGAQPAKGLAYGAADPGHLLNVRAGNMSAFPDRPDHFVRWLAARGKEAGADTFVPRIVYGEYLFELLEQARSGSNGRLELIAGEAVGVSHNSDGVRIGLADGRLVSADAAVLAVGNLPPHDPPGLAGAVSTDRYKSDPWAPQVAQGLSDTDTVLIMGTGLTMVDVALMLEARGFGGRIIALSRRGLLPRRHAPSGPAWHRIQERPATIASELVRSVRARGGTIGWRNAVDELRPYTQAMWANASEAERARFLRHLRPWWDVHRHRLAPQVADRLAAMQARGQLDVVAGKTSSFTERGEGVEVTWRPRGERAVRKMSVQRIINCTGPQTDLARTAEPLLRRLVDDGAIRADAASLGIDVNAGAATRRASGTANDRLFALGPMTRGAFWEIVAVPDIRTQTWALARRLSNSHWVEGEGL